MREMIQIPLKAGHHRPASETPFKTVLKTACSRAKTHVILTPLNYVNFYTISVDDVTFLDGLACVYVKYKSCASTARALSD